MFIGAMCACDFDEDDDGYDDDDEGGMEMVMIVENQCESEFLFSQNARINEKSTFGN